MYRIAFLIGDEPFDLIAYTKEDLQESLDYLDENNLQLISVTPEYAFFDLGQLEDYMEHDAICPDCQQHLIEEKAKEDVERNLKDLEGSK